MDKNGILYELAKEVISESKLESVIRDEIKEKLATYSLEQAIRNIAMDVVKERGDSYIMEQIDNVINGSVRLDDGWGNVKDMGTFDDYVRKSLRKQCFDQWNLERKLKEAVDGRLKEVAKKIVDRHLQDDLVGEVLTELAKDVK